MKPPPPFFARAGLPITRRDAILRVLGGSAAIIAACGDGFDPTGPRGGNPRLAARPRTPSGTVETGETLLELPSGRRARLVVPASYTANTPHALALLLHGAASSSEQAMRVFRGFANTFSLILLAVDSSGGSWDAIGGPFGADVANIDEALEGVFARCAIDPARIGIQGFSDGATYALALGRANGDLFTRIAAQSPGFLFPVAETGTPAIYITHGIFDPVFPVDATGLAIARALAGRYDVRYVEYEGGHEIPGPIASGVAAWLAAPAA